jgi:hypothetical protein
MLLACSSTARVHKGTEGSDSGVDSAAGAGNGPGSSGGRGGSPVPDASLTPGSGGGSGYVGASGSSGASGHAGVSAAGGAGPAGSAGVGASAGMVGAAGSMGSAGLAGTSGTAGSGGASGSAGSAGTAGCPAGLSGPRLVAVGGFCIDSTEVTNAHYAQFLAAKGSDTSGQNAVCSLNQTYEPSAYWPAPTNEGGAAMSSNGKIRVLRAAKAARTTAGSAADRCLPGPKAICAAMRTTSILARARVRRSDFAAATRSLEPNVHVAAALEARATLRAVGGK